MKLTLKKSTEEKSEYAGLKCGHFGCDNIGTISHGTDGKSPFYCRIHYRNIGQTEGQVTPGVGNDFLARIYEHLNKSKDKF
jgi:hypothetical protein